MRLAPLLEQVAAGWDAVRDHPQAHSSDVHVAGRDLRVTVVGDELADTAWRALAGLAPAIGAPSAEIGAWDAEATGVAVPTPPVDAGPGRRWTATRDGEAIVEVALLEDGSIRTADRDAGRYLLAVPSVDALSSWERGAPLRRQLLWALWPAAQLVHAAAVSTDDGVALLAGRSGSGKSSTAIACALAGMGFLGDDHCAITEGPPRTAHLLHLSTRLLEHELEHLPREPPHAQGGPVDADKVLVWPDRVGSTIQREGPVRALLLLEPAGAPSPALEPLRASEALRVIAPSMLWQQHIAPDQELARARGLLATTPLWRLVLGADRASNPDVIAQAIAEAAR